MSELAIFGFGMLFGGAIAWAIIYIINDKEK